MKKYIRSSNYGLVFENYGDVNFLDGGCVVAQDPDNSSCYYVITCDFVYDTPGDHHYLIQNCYVDISDDWIDVTDVQNTTRYDQESNPMGFAVGCVEYYGGQNFGADVPAMGLDNYDDSLYTAEGVEEYMSDYNIGDDIYFDGE